VEDREVICVELTICNNFVSEIFALLHIIVVSLFCTLVFYGGIIVYLLYLVLAAALRVYLIYFKNIKFIKYTPNAPALGVYLSRVVASIFAVFCTFRGIGFIVTVFWH